MVALRKLQEDDHINGPVANTASSPALELVDLSHLPIDEFDMDMVKRFEARCAENPNWRNDTIPFEEVIKRLGLENHI